MWSLESRSGGQWSVRSTLSTENVCFPNTSGSDRPTTGLATVLYALSNSRCSAAAAVACAHASALPTGGGAPLDGKAKVVDLEGGDLDKVRQWQRRRRAVGERAHKADGAAERRA